MLTLSGCKSNQKSQLFLEIDQSMQIKLCLDLLSEVHLNILFQNAITVHTKYFARRRLRRERDEEGSESSGTEVDA